MYKMSYFRFPELFGGQRTVDRVRQQDIPESPTLDVLDEAFTSENWIVSLTAFFCSSRSQLR
jgi:dolichyl-diphosphooligosaccharide--protein glycosyltransferase